MLVSPILGTNDFISEIEEEEEEEKNLYIFRKGVLFLHILQTKFIMS